MYFIEFAALYPLLYGESSRREDAQAEREHADFMARRTCPTCAHHLGGGQCRLNAEAECCEGGGFGL